MDKRRTAAEEMSTDESALDELVAQYLEGIDAGRSISVESIAGLSPELRERFIRFIELAGDFDAVAVPEDTQETKLAPPKESFDRTGCDYGDFRVIRTLGVGGMGVVYLAKHRESDQLVAIKVLRQSIAQDRTLDQRFRREVQAIASLSHANIVPMVSSGFELEYAYFAMELIDGVTLTEVIAQADDQPSDQESGTTVIQKPTVCSYSKTPLTSVSAAHCAASLVSNGDYFQGIAALVATIAEALAVAHRDGIVHRDIKPSNILLDANGKAWLTDFGLASFADDQTALTMTGEIIGTPAYMSPEQAMGPDQQIDGRSDIYSLGATLYELATFQKPFNGNRHQILFGVIRGDVTPPRTIRPQVPADLEAIILKSMALSPKSRYSSATEMAEDLRRFAAGKIVHAKRPNWIERTSRWVEKNQLVALTSLLGLIATIIAIFIVQSVNAGVLQSLNQELESTNQVLSRSNRDLIAREQQLKQQLYVSDVAAAYKAFDERDSPMVRQLLDQHRDDPAVRDLRDFAWHLLDSLSRVPESIALTKHEGPATELALFPGARRAVSVGHDGQAHLFDLDSKAPVKVIEIGKDLDSVAVSPDGASILTGVNIPLGINITTRYNAESGDLLAQWPGHSNSIESASISPNGKLFATADRYNEIQVRDSDGQIVHRITTDSRNESLSFFNSNASIATISRNSNGRDALAIVELASGKTTDLDFGFDPKTFACAQPRPTDAPFLVVAGGMDQIGVVRWPDANQLLEKQQIVGRIRCVDISPDGEFIAAGCDEGSVYVWRLADVENKQPSHPPQVIYASKQRITSIKIVPSSTESDENASVDPRGILTATEGGDVQLWSLPQQNPRALISSVNPGLESFVNSGWAEAPDAETLYIHFVDSSLGVLDSSLKLRRISMPPSDGLEKLIATPDGEHAIVATPTQLVRVHLQNGLMDRQVEKHDSDQNCAAMLVVAGELFALFNDHLMVIDPKTFEQKAVHWLPDDHSRDLVRVPGTDKIYIVTRSNIHELDRGKLSTVATAPSTAENYVNMTFSESGDLYAICLANGSVRIESRDGKTPPISLLGHRKEILDCVFMDNDRTLATTSNDKTIRFWNLATGRELGALNLSISTANTLHYFDRIGKLVTTHFDDPPQVWALTPRE